MEKARNVGYKCYSLTIKASLKRDITKAHKLEIKKVKEHFIKSGDISKKEEVRKILLCFTCRIIKTIYDKKTNLSILIIFLTKLLEFISTVGRHHNKSNAHKKTNL